MPYLPPISMCFCMALMLSVWNLGRRPEMDSEALWQIVFDVSLVATMGLVFAMIVFD